MDRNGMKTMTNKPFPFFSKKQYCPWSTL